MFSKLEVGALFEFKRQQKFLLNTIRDHFIHNGRHNAFHVWRGPRERNLSNKEWEEDFRQAIVDKHQ